jgi:hypothetical protein
MLKRKKEFRYTPCPGKIQYKPSYEYARGKKGTMHMDVEDTQEGIVCGRQLAREEEGTHKWGIWRREDEKARHGARMSSVLLSCEARAGRCA